LQPKGFDKPKIGQDRLNEMSTASSRRDEIWEAKRQARAAPPPRVVPGQQYQAQQQQQLSPRHSQPPTFRSDAAPAAFMAEPAGPPAPGQDPDFDRRVQEQLAKMRAQRMGIPQVAAATLPYDRQQQQQQQYPPPAAPRFDDDVASEMRALEQQLRASTSGGLSPCRQQQQQQRFSPPRGRHSQQQYEQSEADSGGFMARLESHRRSPGSFGKGKGLRYMHDPGPSPTQQQQQQQAAPFHGDDSRSRGSAVAAAAQYRQQQQQQQEEPLHEWPQQQAGPQRQGPGLKGMWEAHDPAAAQARHRGKTEYHRALDAQRAEASQLAATADNSSSNGRGTLRQSLYSQQQQQPYHSRTPLPGGGGTSVAGMHLRT
jgi:hypothetical protein